MIPVLWTLWFITLGSLVAVTTTGYYDAVRPVTTFYSQLSHKCACQLNSWDDPAKSIKTLNATVYCNDKQEFNVTFVSDDTRLFLIHGLNQTCYTDFESIGFHAPDGHWRPGYIVGVVILSIIVVLFGCFLSLCVGCDCCYDD